MQATEQADPSEVHNVRKVGIPAWVFWTALAAGLAAGFYLNFAEMWHRWFPLWDKTSRSLYDRFTEGSSYYTHAPLVPLVSLLIFVLLIRHTKVKVKPNPILGMVVLCGSLLLHLLAALARVNFASGFAFIGVLFGVAIIVWGFSALRRFWFPLLLLVFMIPLPEVTIGNWNFHLRIFATKAGVWIADTLGLLAVRSGNRVLLPDGKELQVADVCNGLRTMISLVAFGTLYAYVCRLRGLWRIGLFLASIPVAVVANSIRIFGLILVAEVWTVELATGWVHDTSGVLVFVAAFFMMFGLEKLVLGTRRLVGRPAEVVPLFHDVRRGPEDEAQGRELRQAIRKPWSVTAIVLIVLSAGVAIWLSRSVPAMHRADVAAEAVPSELQIDDDLWVGHNETLSEQELTILETNDYLNRVYAPGPSVLDEIRFLIVFSSDNRKGTHPPDLCIEGGGTNIVAKGDVQISQVEGVGELPCRELVAQRGPYQTYFLYTYKCGDRYTQSFWTQQLTIFANGLLRRNASGALIRVSAVVNGTVEETRERCVRFMRTAIPHVDRKLP